MAKAANFDFSKIGDYFDDFKKYAQEACKKQQEKGGKKQADPEKHGFQTESAGAFTDNGSGDATAPEKHRSGNGVIKLIRFCALCAIGALIFMNVRPYINIVSYLGSGLSELGLTQFLMAFPPLAWALTGGAALTAFIAGLILWGLLQGLQMLPILITDSPEALLILMSWLVKFKSIKVSDKDSHTLRELKQQFNSIPTKWIETANQARAWAYVFDFGLCVWCYPPIVGGYDRLGVFLAAPMIQDVDWRNVLVTLSAMFGVEVLYQVWKLLNTALELFSEMSHRQSTAQ